MAHLILDGEVARGVIIHNSDLRAPSSVPSRTAAMQGGEYGVNSLLHTPWAQRESQERGITQERSRGIDAGPGQKGMSLVKASTQSAATLCLPRLASPTAV